MQDFLGYVENTMQKFPPRAFGDDFRHTRSNIGQSGLTEELLTCIADEPSFKVLGVLVARNHILNDYMPHWRQSEIRLQASVLSS
jgi:hypothetical protein